MLRAVYGRFIRASWQRRSRTFNIKQEFQREAGKPRCFCVSFITGNGSGKRSVWGDKGPEKGLKALACFKFQYYYLQPFHSLPYLIPQEVHITARIAIATSKAIRIIAIC